MIFDNLGLSDVSLELDFFLWKIVGRALPKNFALYAYGNGFKVALCQLDFILIEDFSAL